MHGIEDDAFKGERVRALIKPFELCEASIAEQATKGTAGGSGFHYFCRLAALAGPTCGLVEMRSAMKIALAADHAGFQYKNQIAANLQESGHEILDLGTHDDTPVDYPDYGFAVGEAIASGTCERGILVCGSSIGIAIAANKVPGIRCASVNEPLTAELARRHNDINVLSVGERLSGWEMIVRLVEVFLTTPFDGGRHAYRTSKLNDYQSAVRVKAQADVVRGIVDGARTPQEVLG
jgi:ribose 5-phosphate isomerase B